MFARLPPQIPAIVVAIVVASTALGARAEERFWAVFRDGSVAAGSAFGGEDPWGDTATLGGRRLFGVANTVAVIRDNTLGPSPDAPRVVMANGDVVPGKVIRFLPASPQSNLPPRLLLSPALPMKTPEAGGLAVRADRVKRIVFVAGADRRRDPGTILFVDGQAITASALHWTEQGVRVLTDTGVVTARFDELAELTVPNVDVIAAVLDDGRPRHGERLGLVGRLETADGAVLTYRRATARVESQATSPRRSAGRRAGTKRTVSLTPSWALGPVAVPVDRVWLRSYRAAGEIPLSLLPAETLTQRSLLHYWPWRRNRNLRGGLLQSGPLTVGLGVATHPYSEIAFELPPAAGRFATLVGLDNAVGQAGCARVAIYRDAVSGKPLHRTGLLRGGENPTMVGPLDVAGVKRLILVTEAAHEDRPPGTDPLDIGDHVDWLLPIVILPAGRF